MNLDREIVVLQTMSVGELRERYAELHGENCRSRHRTYLIRRIVWKMQARAEGGLSERARRRAAELADVCRGTGHAPEQSDRRGQTPHARRMILASRHRAT